MAKITRNSFSRTKNRVKVVEQTGVPVVDSDFNEAQDISNVQSAESALACFSSLRATTSGGVRAGYAVGTEWQPYAVGTAAVYLRAGTLWVDGYQFTTEADTDLTSYGLTFGAVGGSDVYGLIYADFVFSEVDSTSDPEIAVPYVGETAVRNVLSVTYGKSESTISYEDAFTSVAALPVVAGASLWGGNTARVVLGRYYRLAADTVVAATDVFDMRQAPPSAMMFKQPMVKFHKAGDAIADEGAGHQDGYVLWVASSGVLQIGNRDVATDAQELMGAASIRIPNTPIHHISLGTNQEWVRNGAADADGTMHTYDAGSGVVLADGSALGFLAPISTKIASARPTQPSGFTDLYAVTPVPATATKNVSNVQLTVQTLATFEANTVPGTFILCYRKGNDLIWWNGRVTRGSLAQPVLDDPTLPISSSHTINVGKFGATLGNAPWALETALNLLSSGSGSGDLGAGRILKAMVQRGTWDFTRALHVYGQAAEAAPNYDSMYSSGNSLFHLEGEGPGFTALQLSSPENSGRSSTDRGDVMVVAQRVVLRNLTVLTPFSDATHKHGYLFGIIANEVIIENCHFLGGGLWVDSPNITVRNCYVEGRAATAWTSFKTDVAVIGAQHLYLTSTNWTGIIDGRWEISRNKFVVTDETSVNAGIVIDPPAPTGTGLDHINVDVHHNEFYYNSGASVAPALDIRTHGHVSVHHNKFRSAVGVAKAGWTATGAGSHPKDTESFNGSLLSTATVVGSYQAAGYIAVTYGRSHSSKLDVLNNFFDMSSVGAGSATARYVLWAAMAVITCGTHVTAVEVQNIRFRENEVRMWIDTVNSSSLGWTALSSSTKQPAVYGFICAPNMARSSLITSYAVGNISVEDNTFDIGGHTTPAGVWRTIIAPSNNQEIPASGVWLDLPSLPIGIAGNLTDFSDATNISMHGLKVTGNKIVQRPVSTTKTWNIGVVTLSATGEGTGIGAGPPATDNDIWGFIGISVALTGLMYNASGGTGIADTSLNGVDISGNCIKCLYFSAFLTGTFKGVMTGSGSRIMVKNNEITLNNVNRSIGIMLVESVACHVVGNYLEVYRPISGGTLTTAWAAANVFFGNTEDIVGAGVISTFTGGAGINDNFKV